MATQKRKYREICYVIGKQAIRIECPFCNSRFVGFLWSMAGTGKRCPGCGAKHDYYGWATRETKGNETN